MSTRLQHGHGQLNATFFTLRPERTQLALPKEASHRLSAIETDSMSVISSRSVSCTLSPEGAPSYPYAKEGLQRLSNAGVRHRERLRHAQLRRPARGPRQPVRMPTAAAAATAVRGAAAAAEVRRSGGGGRLPDRGGGARAADQGVRPGLGGGLCGAGGPLRAGLRRGGARGEGVCA